VKQVKFRFHALSRMFERKISESDVMQVLTTGDDGNSALKRGNDDEMSHL